MSAVFTVNGYFQEGETLAKHDVTVFFLIGCTNLGTFSINFGYDILIFSETAQLNIFVISLCTKKVKFYIECCAVSEWMKIS